MRHITISVLSVFFVLPAMAGVSLPVVNVASGGVSARSAFGVAEPVSVAKTSPQETTVAPSARSRTVVARGATVAKPVSSVDSGDTIIASADVLMPRRPSNDLWARSDSALRMPSASEFSVMRTDTLLPEEDLDSKIVASSPALPMPTKTVAEPMSEIDAQIARLNDMQRRADASVRNVSTRVISAPIAERAPVAPTRVVARAAAPVDVAPVSVRRMVVPMETPDVVVRSVEKNISPRITAVRDDMTSMSPAQLRQAFRKTFLSENKHLSTYSSVDSRFDEVSDMSASVAGFTARPDLSEGSGIRPLEIKIKFRNQDSSLSRDNYNLLTEYSGVVVNNPVRAVQVSIPEYMTRNSDARKLAARRLAIVEQVLTDNGVSQQRIVPVLSQRDDPSFVLRILSGDEYETLTQKQYDIFGDAISKKTYKSMSW